MREPFKVEKAAGTYNNSWCLLTVLVGMLAGMPSLYSPSLAWDPVPTIRGAHQQVQLHAVGIPGEECGAYSEATED